uniref:NADH-ubiquinone oxidoreductase chain 3 n=1 Tax=Asotana magnifica TaxID=2528170 RepID=A0A4P8DN95_9CRUS|nr:NADH dehydrogenase subunit 3 [Asotana magnifica]
MITSQIMVLTLMGLSMILITTALSISKKNNQDLEKNSQFECGFNPLTHTQVSFSLQFFIITIIFLIFDVEIALLLPSLLSISETPSLLWIMLMTLFIIILTLGTMYEWKDNMLSWK